jgi:hypothetical protein
VETDDSIGIAAGFEEAEGDVAMLGLDQWDAFPDKDGDDVDHEFVDLPAIEKRGDDFTAADQPDVLAPRFAKTTGKGRDILIHKLDVFDGAFPGTAREYEIAQPRIADLA